MILWQLFYSSNISLLNTNNENFISNTSWAWFVECVHCRYLSRNLTESISSFFICTKARVSFKRNWGYCYWEYTGTVWALDSSAVYSNNKSQYSYQSSFWILMYPFYIKVGTGGAMICTKYRMLPVCRPGDGRLCLMGNPSEDDSMTTNNKRNAQQVWRRDGRDCWGVIL